MVKHLRFFMLYLLVLVCAAAGANTVVTFPKGLPSDWTKTGTGKAIAATYANAACLQLQANGEVTSPAMTESVGGIEISLSRSGKGTTFAVSYQLDGQSPVEIKTFTKDDVASGQWGTYTIEVPAAAQVAGCKFVFGATTSSYYISQVEFVSAGAPQKQETTTTFGDGIDDATFVYQGGETPVTRTATVSPAEAAAKGKLSYESDNADVVSVDETTGELTWGAAYGTAKITATYAPDEDALFKGSSAFYYVKRKRQADPTTVVFDASDDDAFASLKGISGYAPDGDYNFTDLNGNDYSFTLHNVMLNYYGHGLQLKKASASDETAQGKLTSPTFDKFPYGYRVTVKYETGHGVDLSCPNYPTEVFSDDDVNGTIYMDVPYADGVFCVSGGDQVSYVQSIELTPLDKPAATTVMSFPEESYTIHKGETFAGVKATVTNELGAEIDGLPIIYTSDNEKVALVDESTGDVVVGDELGTATIKAYFVGNADYKASEASYTLTVVEKQKAEAGFYYEEPILEASLTTGQLTAKDLWFHNPNGLTLVFTSSDENVAEVDDEGTVTLKAVGTTVIKAAFEGNDDYLPGESQCTITVSDNRNEPNLSFEQEEYTANIPESNAGWFKGAEASNPYNLDLTYTSSDTDVAEIGDIVPYLKLIGEGETVITAEFAGNNYFKPGKASYRLVVTNNVVDAINGISSTIAPDAKVFNLQGQSVDAKSIKRGVYVVNGKKVVVK